MECENYKELLQAYHDNELEKGRESFLFTHLSECEDCRNYFKTINLISSNIKREQFPRELDERILYSIMEKETKKQRNFFKTKLLPAVSNAAILILIVISGFLLSRIDKYKVETASVKKELMVKDKTIQLLYNSLPPAEVTTDFNKKNEIIIKAKL